MNCSSIPAELGRLFWDVQYLNYCGVRRGGRRGTRRQAWQSIHFIQVRLGGCAGSAGISLDVAPERVGAAIREIGIGFLFAPSLHTAMRHAMPARRRLGRTCV